MSDDANTNAPAPDAAAEMPLPPASFEFLTLSFKTQAEMHMGLIQLDEDPPQPNARLARHTIDMLAMLQEKTKGNLTLAEQRLIDNSLTELRFRFVQKFNTAGAAG